MTNLLGLEKPVDDEGEPAPRNIALSKEAKAYWVQAYNTIELALAPLGALREIKPTASKASENMARIAAVLTLTANPNAVEIPLSDMEAAAQLMDFYLQEAVRLNSVAETDLTLTRANVLLNWLHDHNDKRISMAHSPGKRPEPTSQRQC